MNRGKIRTRLARILGENATTPRSWTTSTLNDFINDAYQRILVATQVVETRKSFQRKIGQSEYVTPNTFNQILRVSASDKPLAPTTSMALDEEDAVWETRTSATTKSFLTDRLNEGTLRVYPTPDTTDTGEAFSSEFGTVTSITGETFSSEFGIVTAVSGQEFNAELGAVTSILDQGALEVWAKEVPNDLDADTSVPNLPAHTHQAIVFLAAAMALAAQGERHNQELAKAYAEMANEYIQEIRNKRLPEMMVARGTEPNISQRVIRRDTTIPATGLAGSGS